MCVFWALKYKWKVSASSWCPSLYHINTHPTPSEHGIRFANVLRRYTRHPWGTLEFKPELVVFWQSSQPYISHRVMQSYLCLFSCEKKPKRNKKQKETDEKETDEKNALRPYESMPLWWQWLILWVITEPHLHAAEWLRMYVCFFVYRFTIKLHFLNKKKKKIYMDQ